MFLLPWRWSLADLEKWSACSFRGGSFVGRPITDLVLLKTNNFQEKHKKIERKNKAERSQRASYSEVRKRESGRSDGWPRTFMFEPSFVDRIWKGDGPGLTPSTTPNGGRNGLIRSCRNRSPFQRCLTKKTLEMSPLPAKFERPG